MLNAIKIFFVRLIHNCLFVSLLSSFTIPLSDGNEGVLLENFQKKLAFINYYSDFHIYKLLINN